MKQKLYKQHIVQPFAANEACLLVSLAFFIGPSLSIRLKNHINLNTYLGSEGVSTYQYSSKAPKTRRDLRRELIWTTSTTFPFETCPSFTTLNDIGFFNFARRTIPLLHSPLHVTVHSGYSIH